MSKKIKYIVAAVLAAVVCVAVIFTINRKKSGINMNVGELSGDEQNYWNPDIHSISKAENGYYYLHYDGNDLLVKYFDESSKRSVPVCAKAAELYDLEATELQKAYNGEKSLSDVCKGLTKQADKLLQE